MKGNLGEWPPQSSTDEGANEGRLAELGLARHTFEDLRHELKTLGGIELKGTNALTKMLKPGEYIVRRENPDTLMAAVRGQQVLQVQPFADDTRYANCALWDGKTPAGLNNAFLEGYSHKNNVAAVFGFANEPGMDLQALSESASTFAGMERSRVRSFAGEIHPDQIQFVLLRLPLDALPESEMSSEEAEQYDELIEKRLKGERANGFGYRAFTLSRDAH